MQVTPYAGVWIEIHLTVDTVQKLNVTPYAGVWIEIAQEDLGIKEDTCVTPYAGVWIEILSLWYKSNPVESLPTRECGLK